MEAVGHAVAGSTAAILLLHLLNRFFEKRAMKVPLYGIWRRPEGPRIAWGTVDTGDQVTSQHVLGVEEDGTTTYRSTSGPVTFDFLILRPPIPVEWREIVGRDYELKWCWCTPQIEWCSAAARQRAGWRVYWNPLHD